MNFLIVTPKYVNVVGEHYHFPVGLAYISASLKKEGYNVHCLNLNHYDESVETILQREIIGKNIDIFCIGGLSAHFNKIIAVLNIARNIKPDMITIAGGGLISSEPALMLEALKLDFGIIGEGEETIAELADAIINKKDFRNVNGIVYVDKAEGLIMTPPRKEITDLDSVPWPDYDGFEMDKYVDMFIPSSYHNLHPFDQPRELPLIASRSCPYNCTFCYHPIGNKYRQRSLNSIFEELDYMAKRFKINILGVYDELFSTDRKRLEEFCERIKKYNLKWSVQLRVDRVDAEMLGMMKDAGCYYLSYGLESACDKILESMKKKITVSQIEKALKLTREAGIGIQGNFIFGDSAETWETANETLEWWLNHKEYQIWLTPIETYPGTELYHRAVSKGVIPDRLKFIEDGCPIINVSSMSDEEYEKLMGLLRYHSFMNRISPDIISLEKMKTHPVMGDLYALKARCPHCHRIVEYNNINIRGIRKLPCRECNQRFDLPFIF